jgi:DNA-binding response OmpR family regulator
LKKENPLIILLEDEDIVAKLIEYKMSRSEYEYLHFANGVEGLAAIREKKPDLVILDVMLPGMNGFEVLRTLRSDDDLKDVRVIMLTAKSREDDLKTGYSLNIDDYLSKPFKVSELMLRIDRILTRSSIQK